MLDFHPYTLVIVVAAVVIIKNLLGVVGKTTVQDYCWKLYLKLAPILGHSKLGELTQKQHELAAIHRERKSISAQDEYAKWTKLNRQHDKLTAEILLLTEVISGDKVAITKLVGIILTVTTTLPIWFFRLFFRKSVLFYLPTGVLPYYLEWFLAVPFFPVGSVGLTIWMMALNNVFSSLAFLLSFPFETVVPKPEKPKPEATKKEPTKTESL